MKKILFFVLTFLFLFGFLINSGFTQENMITVKMGVMPYLDYTPFVAAHELGLDKDLGINLDLIPFPQESAGIRALVTDSINVCEGSVNVLLTVVSQTPDLRVFLNVCQFKGFVFIGRKGQTKTFNELMEEIKDFKIAQVKVFEQMKGKKFILNKTSFGGMLKGALSNAGLTLDDVEIIDFADDAKAAAAFLRGEGDYYTGSLPQEVKLLSEDGFVAVAGNEAIGPGGLWFSNAFAPEEYINNNMDIILKLTAIHYRTMRYLKEQPEKVIPLMVDYLNKAAATNMTVEEAMNLAKVFTDFQTLEDSKNGVYGGKDSPSYWKKSVDHYIAENEALGNIEKGKVKADVFVIQEEIFGKLLENETLVNWINKDL
jgi:ABC-type nitrate/sulfonate/bicarbonate transport system substrate-binding protein